jgi:hypothetical protein
MAGFLSYNQIRIFDYPRFAEPPQDELRANAENGLPKKMASNLPLQALLACSWSGSVLFLGLLLIRFGELALVIVKILGKGGENRFLYLVDSQLAFHFEPAIPG